ncbi:MAG: MarR family winged helix-turn-helix transcriptional regulator [Nitrososphaeraceae archaeon]|nr:MarR family winged helix-turn-helix transcriptional regulator [Nitrososphaeraceae archaeon]
MNEQFLNFTRNIAKLNNSFMNFIDYNICRLCPDISPTQILLIKNIGEDSIDVNTTSNLGYYTGTNITYNIKVLQKKGYLKKSKSKDDERRVYLKLTEKGLNILSEIDRVFGSHSELLQEQKIDDKTMKDTNKILYKLQKTFEAWKQVRGKK